MKLKLLAAAVAGLFSSAALAVEPFVVRDIRVEGIQRTEAGTVFSYLPVKVGETFDDEKASASIKALYATGFFRDVRLESVDGVLVVTVQERPAIAQIDISGAKEFEVDQLKKAMRASGLSESKIFDRSLLEAAEQELKRQYYSRGKYGIQINTTVTPLERNRVAINFAISEGDIAKITQISIVGNKVFSEGKLLDQLQLSTPGWMTWYTKSDRYSKQKLQADVETLRSFYLNQGYLEFNVESTQVSISDDKQQVFISIGVSEGPKYTVSDIKFAGNVMLPEAELRALVPIQPGDVFSREQIVKSTEAINTRLGNDGYAFANVNAVPDVNKEKQTVAFTYYIDPGRRVYVRRINVVGNTKTRDEVVRREMRQMEGALFSGEKVKRSRERIDLLGYFNEVNVETPAVPETTDQVDVNVSVVEKPTGSINVGVGYGQGQGLVLMGGITQSNIFGSGNYLSLQVNTGKLNKTMSLSFTDPYYTADGISRGFDFYRRDTTPDRVDLGDFRTSSLGAGVRFGVPLNEADTINFGVGLDRTRIKVYPTSPARYVNYVRTFGESLTTLRGSVSWQRDTRDSAVMPTTGVLQRASGEFGLPGGDLKYYRLSYQHQRFFPLSNDITLMFNGEIGVADGYGGKPLPFFQNFYAGGIGSVRGYESYSLGPLDTNDEYFGGNRRVVFNTEVFFPMPGLRNDKTVRLSAFVDGGGVFGPGDRLGRYSKLSFGDLRWSAGVALTWISPMGPLKFSLAQPLNKRPGDRTERLQFQLGSMF